MDEIEKMKSDLADVRKMIDLIIDGTVPLPQALLFGYVGPCRHMDTPDQIDFETAILENADGDPEELDALLDHVIESVDLHRERHA